MTAELEGAGGNTADLPDTTEGELGEPQEPEEVEGETTETAEEGTPTAEDEGQEGEDLPESLDEDAEPQTQAALTKGFQKIAAREKAQEARDKAIDAKIAEFDQKYEQMQAPGQEQGDPMQALDQMTEQMVASVPEDQRDSVRTTMQMTNQMYGGALISLAQKLEDIDGKLSGYEQQNEGATIDKEIEAYRTKDPEFDPEDPSYTSVLERWESEGGPTIEDIAYLAKREESLAKASQDALAKQRAKQKARKAASVESRASGAAAAGPPESASQKDGVKAAVDKYYKEGG